LQGFSATFQDVSRLQPQGKEAQASQGRSDGDGEPRGDPLQRSASPIAPLGVRQRSEEATPKARALCAPIRYLRKEILPIPAS
jgi:hypothetical protein